jgi:molybdopterin-dependent oxidoreductase-like protein protein/TAT (twin-arginine translocation) pathway-exported protein
MTPVAAGRLTNLSLFLLLAVAFASGWLAFELSGQPARAILLLHAAAGVGIVLLVPWKSLIARRGLRRRHNLAWASLVLAIGVLVSIVFGVVHSAGHPNLGYLTAMDFHVGAALCVIPFLLWHLFARPIKLRATDLSRRNFLKGGALAGAAALGVALLPSAQRASTGSFQAAYPVATQWMFDGVPEIDVADWRLAVAGRTWTYDELAAYSDRIAAVIDCTGGWYSEQVWEGVLLKRLLSGSADGKASLNVRSITGYSRRFGIEAADRLLVATRLAGNPLDAGHGYPVRLVVPGQRGFAWVKWVVAIEADDQPWWWQPPFPLQ